MVLNGLIENEQMKGMNLEFNEVWLTVSTFSQTNCLLNGSDYIWKLEQDWRGFRYRFHKRFLTVFLWVCNPTVFFFSFFLLFSIEYGFHLPIPDRMLCYHATLQFSSSYSLLSTSFFRISKIPNNLVIIPTLSGSLTPHIISTKPHSNNDSKLTILNCHDIKTILPFPRTD